MNSENLDSELFHQASVSTANLMNKLISYIENEFKTDRIRATFVAGVLIASLPTTIEENEGGREGVQEIIDGFEDAYKNNFANN
jgi:hypothetical protein